MNGATKIASSNAGKCTKDQELVLNAGMAGKSFDETDYEVLSSSYDFMNRFLVIFAQIRGGKHPFLQPYLQKLCKLGIATTNQRVGDYQ